MAEQIVEATVWQSKSYGFLGRLRDKVLNLTIDPAWERLVRFLEAESEVAKHRAARVALTIASDRRWYLVPQPAKIKGKVVDNPAILIYAGYPAVFQSVQGQLMVRRDGDNVQIFFGETTTRPCGRIGAEFLYNEEQVAIYTPSCACKHLNHTPGRVILPSSIDELLLETNRFRLALSS